MIGVGQLDYPVNRINCQQQMSSIAQVMPQDVVREIFTYFGTYYLDTDIPNHFPWYLGHICSQWRTTLLSIGPRYLSVSSCEVDVTDIRWSFKYDRIANVVTHFLELNRGRQFDINLFYDCTGTSFHQDIWMDKVSHIFGLLAAESARWRRVNLYVCPRACGAALYQLKDQLPSMQSLRLTHISCRYQDCFSDNRDTPRDIFSNTPSLTHVELSYSTWDWEFDWSNLTYLNLTFGVCQDHRPMFLSLQQAINLNTLVTHKITDPIDISERITLPRLESWWIFECRWLSYIKAPALQNLCISGYEADIDVIRLFLSESGCDLTGLTLACLNTHTSQLIEILQHAPELIHLNLVPFDDNIVDSIIESLGAAYPLVGAELLAPRLQSLQVRTSNYDFLTNRTFDGLSQLLSLRNGQAADNGGRPVARLNSLILRKDVVRREGRLIRLCEAFRVELRSPENALPLLTKYQRMVLSGTKEW